MNGVPGEPEQAAAAPSGGQPGRPSPAAGFSALDPRVVSLWRLTQLIAWSIFLLVVLGGLVAAGLEWPSAMPWLIAAWLVLAGVCGWLCYRYPEHAYRQWGYRMDERVLETQSGVIFRVTRLLPLPRLQHVDLQRGPLERAFGLSSLVLHTAGTHEATITIPGLDDHQALRLRDHLIQVGGDDAV